MLSLFFISGSFAQDSTKFKSPVKPKFSFGFDFISPIDNIKQFNLKQNGFKVSRFGLDFIYTVGANADDRHFQDTLLGSSSLLGVGLELNYNVITKRKVSLEFGYRFQMMGVFHGKGYLGGVDRTFIYNHSFPVTFFLNLYKDARIGLTTSFVYSSKTDYELIKNKHYQGLQLGIVFQRNF